MGIFDNRVVINNMLGIYTYEGLAQCTLKDVCVDVFEEADIVMAVSKMSTNEEEPRFVVRQQSIDGTSTQEFIDCATLEEAESKYNELLEEILC